MWLNRLLLDKRLICIAVTCFLLLSGIATAESIAKKVLVLDGEAPGDWFGTGLAPAGDVNGDGFSDFLVGAERNDAGGTDAGRVYLYLGAQAVDAVPDLVITGENAGAFMTGVCHAGDVNGDGFDDFLVGARGGFVVPGRAYLYLGGATPDNVPDLIFTVHYSIFGSDLHTTGDINADGFDDFVIAAPWSWGPIPGNWGKVYIYFGGPGLDNVADLVITGPAGGEFGIGTAPGGDYNGDGYNDLLIGAYKSALGGGAGGAWLFYGGPGLDAVADLVFAGEGKDDWFGGPIDMAGDVNGDGFLDLLIGAHRYPGTGDLRGRAYLYYGGPSIDATADFVVTNEGAGDLGGVGGIGDVNRDGFDDFAVTGYRNDAAGSDAGMARIFYGGPSLDETAEIVLTGEAAGDNFGYGSMGVGDINGDGYTEFAVGAWKCDAAGIDAGRVYIYTTNPGFTPVGTNVVVKPIDPATKTDPVTVTFDSVTIAGITTLEIKDTGPPPPSGFMLTKPKTYYYLTTTAVLDGLIEVCVDYSGMDVDKQDKLELQHYEAGKWDSCTSSHSYSDSIICCDNLSSLSPFALFEPKTPPFTFDIKPRSCPNPFNIEWLKNLNKGSGSDYAIPKKGGVLPAALVGSGDFDVTEVDVSTLRLEGIEPLRTAYEDVTAPVSNNGECACTTAGPDGTLDLTMKFSRLLVAELLRYHKRGDEVELTLTGSLLDGTPIEVSDCVIIVGKEPEPSMDTGSTEVALGPVSPNPFNPGTMIGYYLPFDCSVTIEIFDSAGRRIASLLDEEQQSKGAHTVEWSGIDDHGRPVASGVYFCRLVAGKETISRKMILLK